MNGKERLLRNMYCVGTLSLSGAQDGQMPRSIHFHCNLRRDMSISKDPSAANLMLVSEAQKRCLKKKKKERERPWLTHRYYRRKSGDSEPGPWISDVLTTQLSLLSEARAKEIISVLWASANAVCSSIPLKHFIQSGKTASSQKNGNPLKQEGPVTRAAFTRTRDWLEQLGCHC